MVHLRLAPPAQRKRQVVQQQRAVPRPGRTAAHLHQRQEVHHPQGVCRRPGVHPRRPPRLQRAQRLAQVVAAAMLEAPAVQAVLREVLLLGPPARPRHRRWRQGSQHARLPWQGLRMPWLSQAPWARLQRQLRPAQVQPQHGEAVQRVPA